MKLILVFTISILLTSCLNKKETTSSNNNGTFKIEVNQKGYVPSNIKVPKGLETVKLLFTRTEHFRQYEFTSHPFFEVSYGNRIILGLVWNNRNGIGYNLELAFFDDFRVSKMSLTLAIFTPYSTSS